MKSYFKIIQDNSRYGLEYGIATDEVILIWMRMNRSNLRGRLLLLGLALGREESRLGVGTLQLFSAVVILNCACQSWNQGSKGLR